LLKSLLSEAAIFLSITMPFVVAPEDKAELACTFAALILHDDNLKVDSDNISKLLTAANVQVEPYWAKLYASMLAGKKIGDLLSSAAAPSGGDAPAHHGGGDDGGKEAKGGKADKGGKDNKDAKGGKDAKGKDGGKDKGGDKKKKGGDDAPAAAADDAAGDGEPEMDFSLFD